MLVASVLGRLHEGKMHETPRADVISVSEIGMLEKMRPQVWAWKNRDALRIAYWAVPVLALALALMFTSVLWTVPPYWLLWMSWQQMLCMITLAAAGWTIYKMFNFIRYMRWAKDPIAERVARLIGRIEQYNSVSRFYGARVADVPSGHTLSGVRLNMHVRRTHLMRCYDRLVPDVILWQQANVSPLERLSAKVQLRPSFSQVPVQSK